MIYGPNNIGKSTQMDLLEEKFGSIGIPLTRVKYPVYNLEPTGPIINEILREGNPKNFSPEQTQELFAKNRLDFQPQLEKILDSGNWVLAEDYKGTGIAWGLTFGVSFEKLLEINRGLFSEDLAICLDGERFSTGIERNHLHERSEKWGLNRAIHQELACYFGWEVVNASQLEEKVHADIWDIVVRKLGLIS